MPKYLQILSLVILLTVITSINISPQVGNVTSISISGNTLNLQCGTDLVVFQVCTDNVIMIDLRPNGIKSPDTLIIGNTNWPLVQATIDTSSDPIKITTSKYKIEIDRAPMRFHAYNSAGDLLCYEPPAQGINTAGISLTTTGGNFYGVHNHRDGNLRTTGGNIFAGSQGEAGGPFIWTSKGWGMLADVDSGRIDYSSSSINLVTKGGGSASKNVWWTPAAPTKYDTITVYLTSSNVSKLHWGVNYAGYNWIQPNVSYWPAGSSLYSDNVAVDSPLTDSSGTHIIKLGPFNNPAQLVNSLGFVVRNSDNSWDNNNGNDYHIDFTSTGPLDSTKGKIDMEVYLLFGSPKEIINGMTDVTGKPPLFPKFSLGFLNSQWGIDQTSLLSYVATYRSKGIPIDAYILDFDWMNWGENYYGEFTFGPKFPLAPGGVLKDSLLKSGIKLMGIRKPRVHVNTVQGQYAQSQNYFVDYTTDYFSGKQVGRLNFHRPDVRQWYWNSFYIQGNAYANGIIGYWNDEADEYGNSFNFMQMQRSFYEGQRQSNNKRVWSLNRNYFLGAQRYAYGHWSGDINSGFGSMAAQPVFMNSSILLGSSWWSMDVGGFNGTPNSENYFRWMQFGAFVPIYRVHGTQNQQREPWFYGTEAEQIATQYIKLRYKLLPYIYTAAWENHLTGLSITRPLLLEYPNDPNVIDLSDQWMFGDNMLVKPILTEGASSVSVYLPEGKWIDYWNGNKYSGPTTINYPVTHASIPVFVKAGSVIPTAPVGRFSNDSLIQNILTLSCYNGANGSGSVYEDDGETYNYETGAFATTSFEQSQNTTYSDLNIDARVGSFSPPTRDYLAEFNFMRSTPDSVRLNNTLLTRSSLPTVLNNSITAWAYDTNNVKCYVRLHDNGQSNSIRVFWNNTTGITAIPVPSSFALFQNYPNPFNPSTTIKFSLPERLPVTIKVYDIIGREVSVLLNQEKDAGTWYVPFNASNLANGVYFCRIQAGKYNSVIKMILLK
jgi:alpha-glucosidase (family GH31 glycosyl hydrolase)